MSFLKNIPVFIKFFLRIYGIFLLFLFINRVVFLFTNIEKSSIEGLELFKNILISTFFYGIRFDLVIISYLTVLPLLISSILYISNKENQVLYKISRFYYTIFALIIFIIWAIDIPYFNFFNIRINVSVFEWLNGGNFAIKMIFSDFKFWGFLILFFLSSLGFIYLIRKIKIPSKNESNDGYLKKTTVIILSFFIVFLMIRGRIDIKSPIREGTAFYSNDNFSNYLGLNPVFSFINSIKTKIKANNNNFNIISEQEAIKNMQKYYSNFTLLDSNTIVRNEICNDSSNNKNVVLILMESMSIYNTKYERGTSSLSPFIDSLSENSIFYNNLITCGTHTFNGIYSTLFSFPTIFNQHPLKGLMNKDFNGISNILSNNGYKNYFFLTHDSQFDNIGGFLYKNSFNDVVSVNNFDKENDLSNLGVPDHIMFDYGINYLKSKKTNEPFFAVFLTSSNHRPYVIPECNFKPKSNDVSESIIEYSDWAIKSFFENAKNQSWFENTIFILVADHGNGIDSKYEIPISYIKSPLVIYYKDCPKSISNKIISQVDIQSTILRLLNISFNNTSFSIDMLNNNREFAIFSNEEYLGCIDSSFVYFYKKDGSEFLYNYKENSKLNIKTTEIEHFTKMKKYTASHFQYYNYLVKSNLLK